jgi:hypothetical protein
MASYPCEPLTECSIAELAWLCGGWSGHYQSDAIEEHWSKPLSGAMMGMFRWMKSGRPWLYELMTLKDEHTGVVLSIRHFDAALNPLEGSDSIMAFDLVELSDDGAVFCQREVENPPWLIYRRHGDRSLTVHFECDSGPPPVAGQFFYSRV